MPSADVMAASRWADIWFLGSYCNTCYAGKPGKKKVEKVYVIAVHIILWQLGRCTKHLVKT